MRPQRSRLRPGGLSIDAERLLLMFTGRRGIARPANGVRGRPPSTASIGRKRTMALWHWADLGARVLVLLLLHAAQAVFLGLALLARPGRPQHVFAVPVLDIARPTVLVAAASTAASLLAGVRWFGRANARH